MPSGWQGRPEGRVTPQCCAEYCLASPHALPQSSPPEAAGSALGVRRHPSCSRAQAAGRGGAGREQHSHAGSDGNMGGLSGGWGGEDGTGHRGRWSGRAVRDMLGVGAAATRHGGLVTLSCSLFFDPSPPSQCWVPVAPVQMRASQDTSKSSPLRAARAGAERPTKPLPDSALCSTLPWGEVGFTHA